MTDLAATDGKLADRVTKTFGYVGVALPAIFTLAALAAQLQWLADAPDPMATHWGTDGADGSGPRWTFPLITVALGFGLAAWLWATALPRLRRGSRGWSFRFLAALSAGLAAFGGISMSYSVWIQRGLDSWRDAPSVFTGLVAGFVVGAVVGLVGWVVQPKHALELVLLPQAHVDLADGERAAWIGVAKAGRATVSVMILAVALIFGGAFAAWVAGEFALMWILVGTGVLIAALALMTLEADVRVDADGVSVRGPAGWPRTHVALADVASATPVTVEALGSFGGWGWRRVPGALGVVLRSGPALRVERKEGHALVVTVDDAATAAALLTTLVDRARA
jgi:hypothetical protein